jgi:hypothetical protein
MLQRELRSWRRENHLNRIEAVKVLGYYGLKTTIHALRRWEFGTIPFKRNLKKLERILYDHPIIDQFLFRKITEKLGGVITPQASVEQSDYPELEPKKYGMSGKWRSDPYETNDISSPIAKRYGKVELERETFATQTVCGFGATPSWQWHSF